jgi:ADP-heptose:LPS heptosyltransferase
MVAWRRTTSGYHRIIKMSPDNMRRIDWWIGVPLCVLMAIVFRIRAFVGGTRTQAPRRVLFIELSEMGSVILADPAMRKLQRACDATLYFAIFERNAPGIGILNTVPAANVRTLRADSLLKLALDTIGFLVWCRRERIDTVIDLELFSRFTALLSAVSGAVNRVGFYRFHTEGLYRGNWLTHNVTYNPHIHISKNFVALIHALLAKEREHPFSKIVVTDDEVRLTQAAVSDQQRERLRSRLKELYAGFSADQHRVILINPNASDMLPQRRWPPEFFVAVTQRLLEAFDDIVVFITGASSERSEAEELCRRVGRPQCINSAGAFQFEELVPLYSISRLMLTNDSGPAHFSAVTGLRTFVLYGPETPTCYGSLGRSTPIYAGMACSPCVSAANHRATSCTDNQCLKVIRPEHVYQLLARELQDDEAAHATATT